jgi:radical SAM superfamily enzyme YgiQ (UPF0313 family)
MHTPKRNFELVLIKPSHYDDEGYVIQWLRSFIPSNTLAVLRGLASDCAERRVLGQDVTINITTLDEISARIVPKNQFPRSLDIARPLREANVPVVLGGFHVSGSMAMLPEMQPELQRALSMGVTLFIGEAEGRLDELLQDAARGTLKPIYNYMRDLPNLEGTPLPFMPKERIQKILRHVASFDAGRGCPFQCSFCTIINVQGKKSRSRSPDDIENIIRRNVAQGIYYFFITDDDFARNKNWEAIFDRIIKLRESEEFERIRFTIQVDTQCHRLPSFIEKARRANVNNMFVGLENINADTLVATKKRQNKITDYRALFLACKEARILTWAGYIVGFPNDTPESILRDIEIIKQELPVDVLEFFLLTPLPGSEDHQKLAVKGVWMDPDLNKYDLEHVVTGHSHMSTAEWQNIYSKAWEAYYTPEHIVTVMRRGEAFGLDWRRTLEALSFFHHCSKNERVHPVQGGLLRMKRRRDRCPSLPLENPLIFYPRYWLETIVKNIAMVRIFRKFSRIGKKIGEDPRRMFYMDKALTSVTDHDDNTFELFTHTAAARAAVEHQRKVERLTIAART